MKHIRPVVTDPQGHSGRRILMLAATVLSMTLEGCRDNCIERRSDNTCKVVCTIWQGDRCVHTCTAGQPCD